MNTGDTNEFAHLYDTHINDIYRFVFYRTQKKEIAEDLTSQIFLKAFENMGHYKESKGSFRSWIYKIARNCIIDFYRKNKDTSNVDILSVSESLAEENTDQIFLSHEIQQYLSKLTPEQREIITLRLWEDLSFQEVANILGKSEASCKMMFHRSIRELRTIMPVATFLLFLFFHSKV